KIICNHNIALIRRYEKDGNMNTVTVNKILNVSESYQAPQRMLELMLDAEEREKTFNEFLNYETDLSYEWFHQYFENEHADRKTKKQDFTPNELSELLTHLVGPSDSYHETAAGTGGVLIKHWNKNKNAWFHAEEMSDRSIPFLIFNMAIRGVNGVVLHGDAITREMQEVYLIRNTNQAEFSEVI